MRNRVQSDREMPGREVGIVTASYVMICVLLAYMSDKHTGFKEKSILAIALASVILLIVAAFLLFVSYYNELLALVKGFAANIYRLCS